MKPYDVCIKISHLKWNIQNFLEPLEGSGFKFTVNCSIRNNSTLGMTRPTSFCEKKDRLPYGSIVCTGSRPLSTREI